MGCLSSKDQSHGGPSQPANKAAGSKVSRPKTGVHALKQNYKISEHTKVLGAGAFGKVFLSHSLADKNHTVAIKVLNKAKLGPEHME